MKNENDFDGTLDPKKKKPHRNLGNGGASLGFEQQTKIVNGLHFSKSSLLETVKICKDKNLPIIPISKERIPLVSGWGIDGERWKEGRLDLTDFNWESKTVAGIGLLTGHRSGILAFDFDVTHPEIIKDLNRFNFPSIRKGNPKRFGVVYFKFDSRFSRKGVHVFENGEKLEVLSTGQWVALAPSYYPKTGGVYFDVGRPFAEILEYLPEIPPNLLEYIDKKARLKGFNAIPNDFKAGTMDEQGWTKLERQFAGRNERLTHKIYELRDKGLSFPEIVELIEGFDLKVHPENPYYQDPSEKMTPTKHVSSCMEKKAEAVEIQNHGEDLETPLLDFIDRANDFKIPSDKIGDMAKTMANLSIYGGQEELIYILFHCMIGNIIAQKFCFGKRRITPNFLLTIIGPSGEGKSANLSPFREFYRNHLPHLIPLTGFGSARGMLQVFETISRPMFMFDEISRIIPMESEKTSPFQMLQTEIYDKYFDGEGIQGTTIAQETYGLSHSPRISLIGCGTFDDMKTRFPLASLARGWGRRGFFFFHKSDGPKKEVREALEKGILLIETDAYAIFPQEIKNDLEELAQRCSPEAEDTCTQTKKRGKREATNVTALVLKELTMSPETKKLNTKFQLQMHDLGKATENELVKSMLSTIPEHAIKFAINFCVMEGETEIRDEHLIKGQEVAIRLIGQGMATIIPKLFDSEPESDGLLDELKEKINSFFSAHPNESEVSFRQLGELRKKFTRKKIKIENYLRENGVPFDVRFKKGKHQILFHKK